ncbi:MAG: TonB-dependent receptor [Chitinophagales bacterium]
MKTQFLFLVFSFLITIGSIGQNNLYSQVNYDGEEKKSVSDNDGFAVIRGTVIDDETGETLIGVNVLIEGTSIGTTTDIDGNYTLRVKVGSYNLVYSYVSFAPYKVEQINLTDKQVYIMDVRMQSDEQMLEQVVVSAKAVTNTETAMFTIQKKSGNLLNGISSQTFSKTGDSDAASAIKRVAGVSIEGGKYIYVRGLGDRYSKSILNGMEIPGLDPERNTVQMDIFPTNVIDNILVYKTFTPDLPGDFTGGMVDVKTMDFPSSKYVNFSGSFGYDTKTHFKDEFILYNGNKADAVALGAKSRALPFSKFYEPNRDVPAEVFYNTNSLNKEIAAQHTNTFLDQSYAISAGNQIDKNDLKIGYVVALNYKNSFDFRPDQQQSDLRIVSENNEQGYSFIEDIAKSGSVGVNSALWSAMGSGSIKKNNNKVNLKYLHVQSGEKSATSIIKNDYEENGFTSLITDLDYTQRMISNTMLSGSHLINDNVKVDWANAFSMTNVNNPERTSSEFVLQDDQILFTSSSNLDKVYRDLKEMDNNTKVDFEIPFKQWKDLKSKFQTGVSGITKMRDYETYTVSIGKSNNFSSELAEIDNLNDILAPENIVSPTNNEGYLIRNVQVDDENKYSSSMNIVGAYAMTELPFHPKFKFIGGLRVEYAMMNYKGSDRLTGTPIDTKVLNSFQFLPSANFVYHATENMNVRAAYSRTLARPSFREKSESILYNPIDGTTFYGNLDLVETNIHNADLRWEFFFGRGEMVSVSGFYKKFINPIEIEPLENAGADNLTPVNREQADLYGVEVEFKKTLSFIHEKLSNLAIGGNFTYVQSKIDLSEDQKEKYELVGADAPNSRGLLGQSPYTVNASIGYSNVEIGTEVNLVYNVKGKTLAVVGIGDIPDIYESSFHHLDVKFSQSFGKSDQAKISVSAKNLLGQSSRLNYEFLDEVAGTFRSYSVGRSFSLGFAYTIK